MIRQKPRGPNEQPWSPAYRYECGRGHEVHSDHPVKVCPMTPHGKPCPGTLKATSKKAGES